MRARLRSRDTITEEGARIDLDTGVGVYCGLSSFQGSTRNPFAIRAILSMETLRSALSIPLR
jgi:hypothetical protein